MPNASAPALWNAKTSQSASMVTYGVTQAMESGLTDRVWTIAELVN